MSEREGLADRARHTAAALASGEVYDRRLAAQNLEELADALATTEAQVAERDEKLERARSAWGRDRDELWKSLQDERAQVERQREALKRIAEHNPDNCIQPRTCTEGLVEVARTALSETSTPQEPDA